MRTRCLSRGRKLSLFSAAIIVLSLTIFTTVHADVQSGQVLVYAVHGSVSCSTNDTDWLPLEKDRVVGRGITIKTGADSTADLILQYNGTVLRLKSGSVLALDKLDQENAGDEVITETSLDLKAGALVGSQRKLAMPSRFDIALPAGKATIRGTIYVVRADGAVSCVSGSVSVRFNQPGAGGSVNVTVPAGYSFNPANGQVVATTPAYLADSIADIDTVKENAETFKAGKSTVIVKPDQFVSPTKGNNGVGNGEDPAPPGNPPPNDGPGTGPGNPGNGKGKKP
jgi:hypothetical protein